MKEIRLEVSQAKAVYRFLGKCREASRFFEVCQGPSYRRFVTNAMEDPLLGPAYESLRKSLETDKAAQAAKTAAKAGGGSENKRTRKDAERMAEADGKAEVNLPDTDLSLDGDVTELRTSGRKKPADLAGPVDGDAAPAKSQESKADTEDAAKDGSECTNPDAFAESAETPDAMAEGNEAGDPEMEEIIRSAITMDDLVMNVR